MTGNLTRSPERPAFAALLAFLAAPVIAQGLWRPLVHALGPSGSSSGVTGSALAVAGAIVLAQRLRPSRTPLVSLVAGALVALVPDATERADVLAALTYACRGTWSNCNRGGLAAVTRLLTDAPLRAAVDEERRGLVRLLTERVEAWNVAARKAGLVYPRYDGGFFTTVFTPDADAAALRMRGVGVYVVPIEGALRVGLCSVPKADIARVVEAVAGAVR